MSATRASGANRTSARGGGAAARPKSRVIGRLVLNDAVSNEGFWFLTSIAPITPASNNNASPPRLADQANARGENFAKNPATRAEKLNDTDGLRTGSPSIAANSFCIARDDGAPRLSLRWMVSAYSCWITVYCFASSGSRASASSTRRASRASRVPAACHGNSNSISLGSCSSIFLLVAITASLALRRLPSADRPIFCAHKTSASSRCSPVYRRFRRLLPRISRGSRRDRRSPDAPAKGRSGTCATLHSYPSSAPPLQDRRTYPRSHWRPRHPIQRPSCAAAQTGP